MIYSIPDKYRKKRFLFSDVTSEIIIFGASALGLIALQQLKKRGLDIICFCDNDPGKQGTKIMSYDIIDANTLLQDYADKNIIIASAAYTDIYLQLKSLGLKNLHDAYLLMDNIDLSNINLPFIKTDIERIITNYIAILCMHKSGNDCTLRALDIVITEKCTLKCADCSNLMQFYDKPKNCDVDEIFDCLNYLMTVVDNVIEFRVIGGEPFICKGFPSVVNRLTQYEKCDYVVIYTNATIFPDGDFRECLKNQKVSLQISDYGHLSKALNEMIDFCKAYNVSYESMKMTEWIDYGGINFYDRTENDLIKTFNACCVSNVFTMLNGKLYHCPFSANADNLGAIPDFDNDYLDLNKLRSQNIELKQTLFEFINNKKYLNACNYCIPRGVVGKKITPAIQVSKPLGFTFKR